MPHWNGGHSRCSLSRNHPGQSNTASASFVCSVLAQRFFNRPSHDQIFCRILNYDVELEEGPVANMNGKYWVENYGGPNFWLPGKNEQVQLQWFNNLNNLPSSGWYWLETAQWERALSWDIFLMVRHYFSVCCGGMNFLEYQLIELFLGKFAEVSDPTVGVDFFARLPIVCRLNLNYIFSHSGWLTLKVERG